MNYKTKQDNLDYIFYKIKQNCKDDSGNRRTVKIYNSDDVYYYMEFGLQPIRIELDYELKTIYHVFYEEDIRIYHYINNTKFEN